MSEPSPDETSAARPRVAIVEDDDLVRESLGELLEAAGFEVVATSDNGIDGVRLVLETLPDVTLMDLRMPGMGGLEATVAIKASAPQVHVVVLTAYEDPALQAEATEAGASGYVLKGARPQGLIEMLEQLAGGA